MSNLRLPRKLKKKFINSCSIFAYNKNYEQINTYRVFYSNRKSIDKFKDSVKKLMA